MISSGAKEEKHCSGAPVGFKRAGGSSARKAQEERAWGPQSHLELPLFCRDTIRSWMKSFWNRFVILFIAIFGPRSLWVSLWPTYHYRVRFQMAAVRGEGTSSQCVGRMGECWTFTVEGRGHLFFTNFLTHIKAMSPRRNKIKNMLHA